MENQTIQWVISIGSPFVLALIGGYLRIFLGKALADMQTKILKAIAAEYTRTELLDEKLKGVYRRLAAVEKKIGINGNDA